MDSNRKQVRLAVYENEPLALLARQRLSQERIPCVVHSLGVGPGGWGVATNLPHAVYVKAVDEMRARQVLDLAPREIAEREDRPSQPTYNLSLKVVILLIIMAAALLFGIIEIVVEGAFD